MSCPRCGWPEFTPYRSLNAVRRDLLGSLLSALLGRPVFAAAGKIVRCAKCAAEYVIGRHGVYEIEAGREAPVRIERPEKPKPAAMADADLDFS